MTHPYFAVRRPSDGPVQKSRLEVIREAAEEAEYLLANYLWGEDGGDEAWLEQAHDLLHDARIVPLAREEAP